LSNGGRRRIVARPLGKGGSLRELLGREAAPVLAALLGLTSVAWAALLLAPSDGMEMGAAAFLLAWTVMMAAMMVPSAAPLVVLYGRAAQGGVRWALLAGYLAVWAVFGLGVYVTQQAAMHVDAGAAGVAAVLAAAGLYQLTPLKSACLRRCRSPLDFVMQHWRKGRAGAARLGVLHGAFCVGCCWALMAVLVAAGAMGLAWVALIGLVVLVEKAGPRGEDVARALGIALLGAGLAVALQPELIDRIRFE
jgi:predicted metal-binding membrane protein